MRLLAGGTTPKRQCACGKAVRKGKKCSACYSRDSRRRKGVAERKKGVTWTSEDRRRFSREWAARKHQQRRAAALAAYGGRCVCCGESEKAFLAVDHVGGGGNAHRRSLSKSGRMVGSSNVYAWLERNGFPAGFQLLCHNCNFAKSHGGCPHEEGRRLTCAS